MERCGPPILSLIALGWENYIRTPQDALPTTSTERRNSVPVRGTWHHYNWTYRVEEMEEKGWLGRLLKEGVYRNGLGKPPIQTCATKDATLLSHLIFQKKKVAWPVDDALDNLLFYIAGRVSTVQKREYEVRDHWDRPYWIEYHEEKGWIGYLQGRQKKG